MIFILDYMLLSPPQCLLLGSLGDNSSDKEFEPKELEEILYKLKESVKSDTRQASVWNILGMILLKTGRLQVKASEIIVFFFSTVNNFRMFVHGLIRST